MKDRHIILILTFILTFFGMVMVFSTTGIYADVEYHNSFYFLRKEIIWISIGIISLLFAYNINLNYLKKYSTIIFGFSLFLVALTYTPLGVKVGGAKRWLNLGVLSFQPSEFLKISMVCILASYLDKKVKFISSISKELITALFLILTSMLIVLGQPDFGTAFMMGIVGGAMIFIAGVRFKYLIVLGGSSLPLIYFFIVKFPYRLRRVVAFLDPWADPRGKGFQIVQSFLAIGHGQLTGVGLGESTQKLFYLPAAHTDFIFSIIAEEFGFIGSSIVIVLFMLLSIVGFSVVFRAKKLFLSLLSLGCISYISFQAIFNIAVVTGSVPTKGIPLPFISFGGSSLLMNLVSIGIIMNCAKKKRCC